MPQIKCLIQTHLKLNTKAAVTISFDIQVTTLFRGLYHKKTLFFEKGGSLVSPSPSLLLSEKWLNLDLKPGECHF